jgi:hypothetical protein
MLRLLQENGFIRPNVKGRFHVKTRFATTWVLTRYEFNGTKPTMDFAKFKQRMLPEQQTDAPRAADGFQKRPSDAPRAADSGHIDPPTDALGAAQLVYQGERSRARGPAGSRQAKAEWLRAHLETGAVTPCAVASVLEIRPDDVEAIATGRTVIGSQSWAKIAALAERQAN